MLLAKVLVVIAVLLPMAISTADVALNPRKKRSVNSYVVEGCFSSFPGAGESKPMGEYNSNVKCQETCRDKGYILAATKSDRCECGNIYPKGHKVDDTQCTTKCRSFLACNGPQSCCGGPSAYSVSVVGDIVVAKQVLRRLSHEWQTNTRYRDSMRKRVTKPSTETHNPNWWGSFDREGWSYCGKGRYMTGLYRSAQPGSNQKRSILERREIIAAVKVVITDSIRNLEDAKCVDAPGYLYSEKDDRDCYEHNWGGSFDHKGWSTCKDGYYMTGLYRSAGNDLRNIEKAHCCRPRSQVKSWGGCYTFDVWGSFDREGWSICQSGYYMAGLYRNGCEELYCLEEIKCCRMGEYNKNSWLERPDLVIKVKDTSGKLKSCSMNAMDKSASSSSYKCEAISDSTNMLALNALKFKIEDKSPLNVGKPRPIKGFRPVICSAHSSPYTCKKTLATTISTSSTFTIGSGFSSAVKVGASVEVSAELFGVGATTTFTAEVTRQKSFNVESSTTKTDKTTDNTDVSIEVPKDTEITINLLRTVQDFEYKWQATFELLGIYSAKWKYDEKIVKISEDVTTVLSGLKRKMYAFGSWSYPGTDVIRVVITDKYGNEKEGCEHETAKANNCEVKIP